MLGIGALAQLAFAQFPDPATQSSPILPVPRPKRIVNGWYTDSKGGIYYYYRDEDGNPGPRPPITV